MLGQEPQTAFLGQPAGDFRVTVAIVATKAVPGTNVGEKGAARIDRADFVDHRLREG